MKNRLRISRTDLQLYKALKTVPDTTLIGIMVNNFLAAPKVSKFIELKKTIKQQFADDFEVAKSAFGNEFTQKFQQLCGSEN